WRVGGRTSLEETASGGRSRRRGNRSAVLRRDAARPRRWGAGRGRLQRATKTLEKEASRPKPPPPGPAGGTSVALPGWAERPRFQPVRGISSIARIGTPLRL